MQHLPHTFRKYLYCTLCLLALGCTPQQEPETTQGPPNILFIFTDDHAIQAISAYGSIINKTPNIDRIANEGMLFRHAMVTNSICAPSRAVILSGMHSHLNGVLDNRLPFDSTQVTFPKLLQANGYQTAMIGKWHLKTQPTGFDFWKVLPGQGHYYNPDFRTPEGREQIQGYVTDIVTDVSLDWLKNKRDPNKPFLLMSQHKAPHREWSPGPNHLTMYDGEDIPEPPTLFDNYSNRTEAASIQEMTIATHMDLAYDNKVRALADTTQKTWRNLAPYRLYNRMTPEQQAAWDEAYGPKNEEFLQANLKGEDLVRWKYQRYIKDYLRCIASVDDNIGRILDYLDESGLAENTLIVYSSDQGFYLGEHGWFDKRWMYEESLHMPLVARWPGVIQPGTVNEDLVQNLDFAETFLEVAGVQVPEHMQGRSLLPLMQGEKPADWRESIYFHYHEFPGAHSVQKHIGVRNDRYKLMYIYELGDWELYDLEEDPMEMNSVYGESEYESIQAELTQELERLRVAAKDTLAPSVL